MSWHDQARCLGYPSEMFYGFDGERNRPEREAVAKAVCADCPVRLDCWEAGQREPFGIWAGTTPEERGFEQTTGYPIRPSRRRRTVARSSGVQCSDCGAVVSSTEGLRVHRGMTHRRAA